MTADLEKFHNQGMPYEETLAVESLPDKKTAPQTELTDMHQEDATGGSHTCKQCGYAAENMSSLAVHTSRHTDRKPNKCDQCDYSAKWKWQLDHHIAKHHEKPYMCEKPYKCDRCDYSAAQKGSLKQHKAIHTSEKPYSYTCDECGYTTAQRSKLSRHMRRHTDEKPYKCDECDYSAAWKSSVDRHMADKHNGEKSYMCEKCGYRTATKSRLSQHMKVHTGEKPYKCDQCDFSSPWKKSLGTHMAKHTGKDEHFSRLIPAGIEKNPTEEMATVHGKLQNENQEMPCEQTLDVESSPDKKTVSQAELVDKHQQEGSHICKQCEKPYKCDKCEYSSVRKSTLHRHMATHGGEKPYM
ncbi:zinc finger protein 525-like [Branchiostoma floridae]|uniref:Zinc finger protein 525-like n=1 Tax=Branchiostoma floridae TaxID=7739 RepID=A0A9J7LND2_BRAFL|nr:zinc finger protein 525-like [Branchiostoma floridae]